MNRKEAAELLPIIQAYAEGETIQVRDHTDQCGMWEDVVDLKINTDFEEYRIKPKNKEAKYRPFANAEECWAEMQKHQPVGFMKFKDTESGYYMLTGIARGVGVGINDSLFSYDRVFDDYTFADGLPFGVKVEE